jgi:hypothetical protein
MLALEEKVPIILQHLEDIRAAALTPGSCPSIADREHIKQDYDFAVQRYLDYTSSMLSDYDSYRAPIMQISSLGGSQGLQLSSASIRISAYETMKTHFARTQALGTAIEEDEECTQVFVKGPGNQTSALQVESNFMIIHVQFRLSQSSFSVPFDNVFYTFGRKVLNDGFSLTIQITDTMPPHPLSASSSFPICPLSLVL